MAATNGGWSDVAAVYARSFETLCAGTHQALLDDVPGPVHLDVGCGTGTLAAAAIAQGRTVTAVDVGADMVRHTLMGVPGARVVQAALPRLGVASARFDCVTANFVVNHLPDPRAGVRELARVVRPGGRVAVTSWLSRPTPRSELFAESFAAAGAIPVAGQRLPAELDFDRSAPGLAGLLAEAGLETVVAREVDWTWAASWHELWTGVSGGIASTGELYLAQDEPTRRRVEHEIRQRARTFETDGVLRVPATAAYAVGQAPG